MGACQDTIGPSKVACAFRLLSAEFSILYKNGCFLSFEMNMLVCGIVRLIEVSSLDSCQVDQSSSICTSLCGPYKGACTGANVPPFSHERSGAAEGEIGLVEVFVKTSAL